MVYRDDRITAVGKKDAPDEAGGSKNEELAGFIEAWEREEDEVRRLDPDGEELPDAWRMTALKCILVGRLKEHVEITAGRYLIVR